MTGFSSPVNGLKVKLQQPDGTTFEAKAFGDEFYSWLETEEGHVVIQEPRTRKYTYAKLSEDGDEFESTGILAGKELSKRSDKEQKQIQNLKKKIRISTRSRKEKIKLALKHLNRDTNGRIILPDTESTYSEQPSPTEVADTSTAPLVAGGGTGDAIAGSRNALAINVYFPDYPDDATVMISELDSFYNDINYTADGNATSVRQYFRMQSHDQLDITHVVTDWFEAPNNRAYYNVGAPDKWTRFNELIVYRLEQLKAEGFDFTQLDANNDGQVDCISLFYAGGWLVGGWAGTVDWPGFADYGLSTSCPRQISPMEDPLELAVVCHEIGHAVCNFPDLYPAYSGSAGTEKFCLMSQGNWSGGGHHPASACGPMKYEAGWVTAVDVTSVGQTDHSLQVDGTSVVRYVNPYNPLEYYLFEMRGEVGYEAPLGGSSAEVCPSKGLVIYHVDENGNNAASSILTSDNPNCDYSTPPRVLVVEDNPKTSVTPWYDDPTPDEGDAFDTGDVVVDTSTPDLAFWSDRGRTIAAGITITNIQINTSNLTFSITKDIHAPIITASSPMVAVGSSVTLSVPDSGSVTYSWSKLSGPGAVTFDSPDSAQTTASFDTIGLHVVQVLTSDGNNQLASEIAINVTAGLDEYAGRYTRWFVENGWHIGSIEITADQLQWRNDSGVVWNLLPTEETDLFVTDATCPYGPGMEWQFVRQEDQITGFDYLGFNEIYQRLNPIGSNAWVATPRNVAVDVTLTAYDEDNNSQDLTYSIVTQPANGQLSGVEPNLIYSPYTNFTGTDAFTFTASDGSNDSNIATISIKVYNPGDGPAYSLVVLHGEGDGEYQAGAQATITADTPPNGKIFDRWLGDVVYVAEERSAATTVTMPEGEVVLTATYGYASDLYDSDNDGLDDSWEIATYSSLTAVTGAVAVNYQDAEFIVTEGSNQTAYVTLNGQPYQDITVQIALNNSDPDISLTTPQNLVFAPTTWSNAQQLTIAAATDADDLDSNATVDLTAPGFISASFTAYEYDTDRDRALAVASMPAALSQDATSARLSGTLTNGFTANAWICWGERDSGTLSTGDWENIVSVGAVMQDEPFSKTVTDLKTNTVYWYRCYASNGSEYDWSDEAELFNGKPVILSENTRYSYIGVNFVGEAGAGGTLDPEDVAGYVAQTNWNNMCASSANDTLNTIWDSEGVLLAGMSVDTSVGAWDSRCVSTANNEVSPHSNLFEGFLQDNETPWATRIAVAGIPFETYDVYVYLNSENNGRGAVRLNGGGTEYYAEMGIFPLFTGYTVSEETSTASGTYNTIIFSNVTGNTLDIDMYRSGARIGVSGIQICGLLDNSIIKNLAPTDIGSSQATVGASLSAEGESYDVYIHYGTSDGGTNSWMSNELVGSFAYTTTNFSHVLSGLSPETTYYYTFRASNAETNSWASPSWSFTTQPATDGEPVTTNHSVPHAWLEQCGWTNEFESVVTIDHDGDGYATWQEYWAGTDPNDSSSRLKIDSVYMAGNSVCVEWQHSTPDPDLPRLAIFATTNLVTGPWVFADDVARVDGTNTWLDSSSQHQYYRLVVTVDP
ncbi:hypothetical protein BVX97_01070 [bacterium E08(2017)]|nr:hypothetical protein BVX97_01070 [bacterium E08(2017)]